MGGKNLIVVEGPTGVGKSDFCIGLAQRLGTDIISADSRQIYKGMEIGTAAPTPEQKAAVRHHFVGCLAPTEYYSAAMFEADATALLGRLFAEHDSVVMTGGSMMYVDAVCNGIDDIPTVDDVTRAFVKEHFEEDGLEQLCAELKLLDPDYYFSADIKNPKRVMHALEICYMTGKPYSRFLTSGRKPRGFNIIKVGLTRPREELYDRINRRVDAMMLGGLEEEARSLYALKGCNALNTVGYKELFEYFDGKISRQEAVEKIKQDSRIYARKQMTWFKRDADMAWFSPDDWQGVANYLIERGLSLPE